ncbi:hypothetical protein [Gorillibacterium timonense]|uniref:hypothetical protein n=1 Tax=Gorillibacterium timonense TaxID=1689269 RepID=UPI00071CBD4F|nr:hypothetical protein [Gorillibacterium timonense]
MLKVKGSGEMSLMNCKRCGRLMVQQRRSDCCESCRLYYDESYREIRRCLHSQPHLTAYDVHKETGIPLSVVLELVRS